MKVDWAASWVHVLVNYRLYQCNKERDNREDRCETSVRGSGIARRTRLAILEEAQATALIAA
jgi:hypothetical protein